MRRAPFALFSARSAHDLTENELTGALARARARGPVRDLTASNPTTVGLPGLSERGRAALSAPSVATYAPLPFGLPSARAAIAASYRSLGAEVDPARVVCTASTSEAYSWLFGLLADVGDEVLVPQPSYPLFSYLARHQSVVPVPYPLRYDGAWHIDLPELRARTGPRTRAIVLVSPNNPTGSYTKQHELDALLDLNLPLVSDEVFTRYPLLDAPRGRVDTVAGLTRGLAFALSGLSKEAALPQLKLGWIVAAGEPSRVTEALARLEITADTFLSVSAPVQAAAPLLLDEAAPVREALLERVRKNLRTLDAALGSTSPLTRLHVEGGWYATLRLPRVGALVDRRAASSSEVARPQREARDATHVGEPHDPLDEDFALQLLERDGVYVHPGSFFELEGAHVVLSLLTEPEEFRAGALALRRRADADLG